MAAPFEVEPPATSIHMPRARTVPSLANVHCCALLVLHAAICKGAPSKGSLAGISRQWPLPTPMSCPVHPKITTCVGAVVCGVCAGVVGAGGVGAGGVGAAGGAGAAAGSEVETELIGVSGIDVGPVEDGPAGSGG